MAAATSKREPLEGGESQAKKAKISVPRGSAAESISKRPRVTLNPADCDLDFSIEEHGLQGYALYEQGFAYCWSGSRATVGITGGKYCFGCKILAAQPVQMEDTPPNQRHVCRIGISRGDDMVGSLGETAHSFGYGGTGKFSNAGKFENYGDAFGVGDTVLCVVDLENRPLASIGFSKNGKWLGTAKFFNAGGNGLGVVDSQLKKLQWESALFPHILLKNVVVQLHFSIEDGLLPEEGYKPWASALDDGYAIMGPPVSDPNNCEVMMMVGLPASGKTTWAEKWMKEQPEKRYVLLGTNLALDQMKVPGLLRKHNYGERFEHLMQRATGIFNTLLSRAVEIGRNYIIDQTNVYKSARKRKIRPFTNFQKIAVVVFPKPEELKFRGEKRFREMGKEVPAEAVNEMLANYALPLGKYTPGSDEYFDEVMFPELSREEAEVCLHEMKRELGSRPMDQNMIYSRENSVNSSGSITLKNCGTPPASGGHWQSYQPSFPQLDYDNRRQGHRAHFERRESFSEAFQSNQVPPFGPDYMGYGSCFSRDNFTNFQRSPSCHSSRRPDGVSGVVSTGDFGCNSSDGVGYPYGRLNVQGRSSLHAGDVNSYWSIATESPSPGQTMPRSTDPHWASVMHGRETFNASGRYGSTHGNVAYTADNSLDSGPAFRQVGSTPSSAMHPAPYGGSQYGNPPSYINPPTYMTRPRAGGYASQPSYY